MHVEKISGFKRIVMASVLWLGLTGTTAAATFDFANLTYDGSGTALSDFAGEVLKLSFDQVVSLSDVGLRAEGHNTTAWLANATFEYSTNGTTWTSALLPDNGVVGNTNAGRFVLNLTGQDFYFRYGGQTPDQFYISSVTVAAVPEPETYALMGLGLGLIGFMARRRKFGLPI